MFATESYHHGEVVVFLCAKIKESNILKNIKTQKLQMTF